MPVLSLPEDLKKQLVRSETGTINNTQGPGVADYWASDGSVRADIYIGLQLDGVKLYENISSVDPNIKLQFAIQPMVYSLFDDLDFNPNKDEFISIEVSRSFLEFRPIINRMITLSYEVINFVEYKTHSVLTSQ